MKFSTLKKHAFSIGLIAASSVVASSAQAGVIYIYSRTVPITADLVSPASGPTGGNAAVVVNPADGKHYRLYAHEMTPDEILAGTTYGWFIYGELPTP